MKNAIRTYHYDVGFAEGLVSTIEAARLWTGPTSSPDSNDYRCQQASITAYPQLRAYDAQFEALFKSALRTYNAEWNTPANEDAGYTLLRYRVGDECTLHYDYAPYEIRICTAMLYLNDDYEGGDLVFPLQDLNFRPKRGELIMMPASYLYPHQVLPITKGERLGVRCFYRLGARLVG